MISRDAHAAPIKMQDANAKLDFERNQTKNLQQHNHVQIIETEASIRCGLKPGTVYELVVELSQIVLQQDNNILFLWPFKHVRRYGYTSNSFSIEAGSKCDTGEGLFIFRGHKSIQMYNQIIANVTKIKQLKTRQLLQRSSNVTVAEKETHEKDKHQQSRCGDSREANIMGMVCLKFGSSPNNTLAKPVPHYVHNNCEYAEVKKRSKYQAR